MSEYIITNGIKYLRCNKRGEYCLVHENDATTWRTYKQALNALNNGLSKCARKTFYVDKPCKATDPKSELERLIEADTGDFESWAASIGDLDHFFNTLDDKKTDLYAELRDIDLELCDIKHYIEFGRLNAYQGWEAY